MTSQRYYKDRLGFDPNEAHYETSSSSTRKTSSSRAHLNVTHHYHSSSLQRQQQQQQQQQNHHHSAVHHHHHSSHSAAGSPARISVSPGGASIVDHYVEHSNSSTSPAKKAKHSSTAIQPQGGYEDALTQFKGSKSVREYFIDNWYIIRKSCKILSSIKLKCCCLNSALVYWLAATEPAAAFTVAYCPFARTCFSLNVFLNN